MDIVLIIIAGLLVFLGVVGSIVPALPGPPLGFAGLVLIHFTEVVDYSTTFLVVWGIIILVVTVLDNVLPLVTTKMFGGSKWGMRGSIIGLFVGLFFPPIGIIFGVLMGTIIGELMYERSLEESVRSGIGAFVGFILTTGAKLVCCGFCVYYYTIASYDVVRHIVVS